MSNSILKKKSFEFAVRIVRLAQRLQREHKEFVLSTQILKSGTSPGALNREAEFAQSKRDFINKIGIGLKEANETDYWLALLNATDYIDDPEYLSLKSDCGEIKAMSISSIRTAQNSLAKEPQVKPKI